MFCWVFFATVCLVCVSLLFLLTHQGVESSVLFQPRRVTDRQKNSAREKKQKNERTDGWTETKSGGNCQEFNLRRRRAGESQPGLHAAAAAVCKAAASRHFLNGANDTSRRQHLPPPLDPGGVGGLAMVSGGGGGEVLL